jgi:hypothetical protein
LQYVFLTIQVKIISGFYSGMEDSPVIPAFMKNSNDVAIRLTSSVEYASSMLVALFHLSHAVLQTATLPRTDHQCPG